MRTFLPCCATNKKPFCVPLRRCSRENSPLRHGRAAVRECCDEHCPDSGVSRMTKGKLLETILCIALSLKFAAMGSGSHQFRKCVGALDKNKLDAVHLAVAQRAVVHPSCDTNAGCDVVGVLDTSDDNGVVLLFLECKYTTVANAFPFPFPR